MAIGDRILELRKQKNISQGKLAKTLGISRQAVSKWETNQSSPDTLNLIKLADLLETDVEYLATGKSAEQTPAGPAPIVVNLVEKTDKYIDRIIEKPVIKKVVRIKYRRNPVEMTILSAVMLLIGFLAGYWYGAA